MATTNYGFPTIEGTDTADGVSAINGLANSVDAALKVVENKIGSGSAYELPTATSYRLGGVKVGSGVSVTEDGTISVTGGTASVPVATKSTVGTVKIGSGLSIDRDGTLSLDVSAGSPIEALVKSVLAQHVGSTWNDLADGFIKRPN